MAAGEGRLWREPLPTTRFPRLHPQSARCFLSQSCRPRYGESRGRREGPPRRRAWGQCQGAVPGGEGPRSRLPPSPSEAPAPPFPSPPPQPLALQGLRPAASSLRLSRPPLPGRRGCRPATTPRGDSRCSPPTSPVRHHLAATWNLRRVSGVKGAPSTHTHKRHYLGARRPIAEQAAERSGRLRAAAGRSRL